MGRVFCRTDRAARENFVWGWLLRRNRVMSDPPHPATFAHFRMWPPRGRKKPVLVLSSIVLEDDEDRVFVAFGKNHAFPF